MKFFGDTFKKDPDKSFIVNYAPIFAGLDTLEKDIIIKKSKIVEYNKGDIIYKLHDAPDAFYCVVSGRVRIFTHVDAKEKTLEYLNCGKYFGIISLFTGEPHSVNAQAVNNSKILKINKEDFREVLNKIPKLAVDISLTLSRRLRKKDTEEKSIFESNIISVFSAAGEIGRTMYALNLSLGLKKETGKNAIFINVNESAEEVCRALDIECRYPAIKLDTAFFTEDIIRTSIYHDPVLGIGILSVRHDRSDETYAVKLNSLLTYLTGHYHFIVVDLPVLLDVMVFEVLSQSDIINIITDYHPQNLEKTRDLVSELSKKVNYPYEKIKIIMNLGKEGKALAYEEVFKILNYKLYATLPFVRITDEKPGMIKGKLVLDHPQEEYSRVVRRIAREIGDVRVGLALSGGAAFGLAHVGVIKVLEREGISIDMVSGSSMGALIGALWAIGLTGSQIEAITAKYNTRKKVFNLLFDICFPKLSFVGGRNIRAFLNKYLGDKTFQDIKFPFKIVACNLSKRQEFAYDSGRLVDAVEASIAIPGVFPPQKLNGDLLVDGGIIQPIPIGILVKSGIKKIIAVNTIPSPEDIIHNYEFNRRRREEERKEAEKGGFLTKIIYKLRIWFNKMFFPNILDIIVNSIQTTEYVIAETDAQKADVVIRPIVIGTDWYEFYKADVLIKKGEEETNKAITAIKNIIKE